MSSLKTIGEFTDDPLIQVIHKKYYRAFTTKDKHECAEALSEIQYSLALGLVTHGVTIDESGIAYRVQNDEYHEDSGISEPDEDSGNIPPDEV